MFCGGATGITLLEGTKTIKKETIESRGRGRSEEDEGGRKAEVVGSQVVISLLML